MRQAEIILHILILENRYFLERKKTKKSDIISYIINKIKEFLL